MRMEFEELRIRGPMDSMENVLDIIQAWCFFLVDILKYLKDK